MATPLKPALFVLEARYAVCRLPPDAALPAEPAGAPFWSATRTADELSLVLPEAAAPTHARVETGWRCIGLHGPIPFTTVGVLASLTTAVASAGISVFALSTFDTDYLLVKEPDLVRAIAALRAAGHPVDGARG